MDIRKNFPGRVGQPWNRLARLVAKTSTSVGFQDTDRPNPQLTLYCVGDGSV